MQRTQTGAENINKKYLRKSAFSAFLIINSLLFLYLIHRMKQHHL